MRFTPTGIPGAFLIALEPQADARGFFARTFCEREFAAQGLASRFVQCSLSLNQRKGTLRGLHYQKAPAAEVKIVRCIRGRVFDVLADLRPSSPMFRRWASFELTEENRLALYVPEDVAHGYQTLTDHTEILYQMSEFYAPDLARGIRWDDPALNIPWPVRPPILSEKDAALPSLGS